MRKWERLILLTGELRIFCMFRRSSVFSSEVWACSSVTVPLATMHKNFRFSKFRGSTVSWDENEGVSSKVKVFFLMTQTVAMEITHQEKLVHRRDVDHRAATSLSLHRHKNILYFICQVAKWKISYQEFLVMITRPLLHWYLYRIHIAKPPCLRHVLLFFHSIIDVTEWTPRI